ncbi:MAG: ATP-binding protein [Endomicrobium sp.]|jgi:Holliday junction resolvase-like predicted endonuclease|nr:ATP-binding protein [Endomicrobium sp.]
MKNLPIGAQSFEILRQTDCVYIDKTKHVFELIKNGRVYFHSRPRRFGKSLLISVFEELFNGNKKLFEGLYIYDKWNWEEKYPVIHLDFAELKYSSGQELNASIEKILGVIAKNAGISLEHDANGLIPMQFAELIKKLHKAYGSRVVILVDEYDKPVTDNLSNKEVLSANKRILHDFYQVIKATDEHLKFVFLTGVSKFSGLSVFSALNSINDITVDERYSTICGYTQEELEEHFKDYIEGLSKELNLTYDEIIAAIKDWYNGYSWDGKISVYNPFSTLMLFDKKEFANYWFRTGTPTFLLDLIRRHNRPQNFLGSLTASDSSFESYNPDNVNEIPLLFQMGYLTIKNKVSSIKGVQYTLGFPDIEVKDSFLQCLLSNYTAYPQESIPELFNELSTKFQESDAKGLEDNLKTLLAHIPYQLISESEKYYHSIFLIWLKTLGFDIQGEISTNRGRIDAVLKQNDYAVITEIKYSTEKELEEMLESALKQIDDKKYYEAYLDKKIILLAIAFNGKDVKCKFKTLDKK